MNNTGFNEYPLVAIVIVNYNGLDDTLNCLSSLSKISYPNYKIIVVDNASQSDELGKIKSLFPQHWCIQSNTNNGFSGGNNIGIKHALSIEAKNILLLNNDTIVELDFLQPLVKYLNGDEKAGMVTPQICYLQYPDKVWMSGGVMNKMRGTGFRLKSDEKVIKSDSIELISFVSGCCALIKSEVFYSVGYWNEEYFLYVEDVDYSLRVTMAGYSLLLVNDSIIYHKINASTGRNNSRQPIYYTVRNRLYFSKLYFDIPSFFAIIYILSTTMVKMLGWVISDREKYRYAFRAIVDFLSGKMGRFTKLI